MIRVLTGLCCLVLSFAILSYAQQPPTGETSSPETQSATPTRTCPSAPATSARSTPQAAPAAAAPRIAPGSVIPVELTKTIDAKKAKTGDEVVAKVTQDLKNTSGTVILPKDTEVVGQVSETQRRTEEKESELAISFDKAVLKNGETMQMPMLIQAIIAPPHQNNEANEQASTGYPGGGMPGGTPESSRMPGSPPGSQGQMGGGQPMPTAPSDSNGNSSASESQPQITGNTKGVIGISNLTLSAAPKAAQGSLITSEKSNVKLEGGTLMLLRVK